MRNFNPKLAGKYGRKWRRKKSDFLFQKCMHNILSQKTNVCTVHYGCRRGVKRRNLNAKTLGCNFSIKLCKTTLVWAHLRKFFKSGACSPPPRPQGPKGGVCLSPTPWVLKIEHSSFFCLSSTYIWKYLDFFLATQDPPRPSGSVHKRAQTQ